MKKKKRKRGERKHVYIPDNTGKKYNGKKQRGANITKKNFLAALPGTLGSKSELARRLGVTYYAIRARLKRPDWADMKEAWEEEAARAFHCAEHKMIKLIKQNDHLPSAFNASKFVLTKKEGHEEYGYTDKKTLVHEGGDKPVQIESSGHMVIDIGDIFSVEQLRQIMDSVDKGAKKPKKKTKKKLKVKKIRKSA